MFTHPHEYIGELIDKGVRLITNSPVLNTGWRYNDIPFDNHVGIHRGRILTAPSILQGARRFEGIKTFDYYIGANVNVTETEKLEEAHYEDFQKKYSPTKDRAYNPMNKYTGFTTSPKRYDIMAIRVVLI